MTAEEMEKCLEFTSNNERSFREFFETGGSKLEAYDAGYPKFAMMALKDPLKVASMLTVALIKLGSVHENERSISA